MANGRRRGDVYKMNPNGEDMRGAIEAVVFCAREMRFLARPAGVSGGRWAAARSLAALAIESLAGARSMLGLGVRSLFF